MACQAMHTWSLSGLVGAFVDLSISYLLLCASAIVFMASKFLGFLGLYLPCPCDGLFVLKPNRNLCFHKLFIDYPADKVSNVQVSVRSKFPFFNDSIWGKDQNCNLNLRLIGDKERDVIELEGEASCSSALSDARNPRNNVVRIKGELNARNEVGGMELLGTREGSFDMKGKEIMHQRPRSGIRHRRKWSFNHGKKSSFASSYDPRVSEVQGGPESPPSSVTKGGSESAEDDIRMVLDNEIDSQNHDHEEVPTIERLGRRYSNNIKLDDIPGEDETIKKNKSGNSETGSSRDDEHTIRILEQALEEERAAHTALYLELDNERSAAASAADEAMAMILRLQEEKALVEMEARQYQRIIEGKSAYDAEEMNILKEIIIRREREKHFLEKEVEAYRKMINLGDDQSTENIVDMLDSQALDSLTNPDEDPVFMLQQLSIAIDKKNGEFRASKESLVQEWDENAAHLTRDLPQFSVDSNEGDQELEDKMVPIDSVETLTSSCKVSSSLENFTEENISLIGEGKEQSGKDTDQGTGTSRNSSDKVLHVHDVHVIVNKSDSKEESMQKSTTGTSTSSNLDAGVDNNKSTSDMVSRLPPLAPKGKSQCSHMRRNSMPALDNERLKLDNEVGRLRERLRIVQEGRKKLNLSVEPRERDNLELKLLEDIAHQFQEIRQLKMLPGKAARQASLPLPSSKVTSKKKRCRSASSEQLTIS